MKMEITVQGRHAMIIILFIIAVSAVGIVVAYGGSIPSQMGHTWEEMECSGCITCSNLADGSVTSTKIQDGSITGADVDSIDGGKITGTVPNAQTISNTGIGNNVYSEPAGCGGGVTITSTCTTLACDICYEGYGCYSYYYNCGGTCSSSQTVPATCPTTYLGKLLE
jgi:hypothetical protein